MSVASGVVTYRKVTIGDVAHEGIDRSGPSGSEFRYVDISSIDRDAKKVVEAKALSVEQAPSRAKQRLEAGDVLVSMTRPNLNAVALVTEDLDGSVGSTGFHVIRSNEVEPKFIYYLVQTRDFIESMCAKVQGALYPAVRPKDILEYSFRLPPSREYQQQIVEKIEILLSELDAGIEALKIAQEQLKVYRQAVLKHAFEGKFTAQWRKENNDKLAPPEHLFHRIQKDREVLYQHRLKDWEASVRSWEKSGKEGKKPRRPKKPPHPNMRGSYETDHLPDLPHSWVWVRPEDIMANEDYAIGIGPFGSNLKVSDYRESGIPLIFVRNITRSDFDAGIKYISSEKFLELVPHSVKPLDLVITKMGDPPGDCEIYPADRPVAVLTADCLKFRLSTKYTNHRFFKHCINSRLVKTQLGLITKGVAQKKISSDRFKTILMPLPPVSEQHAIAEILEGTLSIIEHQESSIDDAIEQSNSLRQSILKMALFGPLVSNTYGS